MLKQIKNEFVSCGKPRLMIVFFVIGLYLVGLIMVNIIMRVDSDPGEYFPLATLMAVMAYAMGTAFFDGISFVHDYQLAIIMGCTRRTKLISHIVACLIKSAAALLVIIGLGAGEHALYMSFFASYGISPEPVQFLKLGFFLLFLIVPQPIALFIAGVSCRFSKKGYMVLYFVFLFFCLFGTRIVRYIVNNAEGSTRWLVSLVKAVPLAGWMGLGAAVLVLIAVLGTRWLYKCNAVLGWS